MQTTRRKKRRARKESGSYWTSYSDMMAALMLVFALVMFFSIFQFLDLQETKTAELATKESQLEHQQSILIAQESELSEKESALQLSLVELEKAQSQLDEQESLLASSALQLSSQQEELDEQSQLLLTAQQDLDATKLALSDQQTLLDSQRELMDQQQVKIEALIGVRTQLIQTLSQELRKANLDMVPDPQTGAITMKGAVLFDSGSDKLKESGMALLDSFMPVYVRTLMAEENRDFVGEIIIEGHADTDGDYLLNLDLSQRRALAVTTYCLADGFGGFTAQEQALLRNIMTANGRSWSNPIYNADGTIDKEASRRVEFKFRLKDDEMIDEMSRLLEEMP